MRWKILSAAVLLLGAAGCCCYDRTSTLIGASRNGDTKAVAALIQAGAEPNRPGGVNGWPPLMHAIHKNQPQSVRTLLAMGANPNVSGNDGTTPLMMAAGYGFEGIVRDLLDHGADPSARHPDGSTALDFAVSGVPDIDRFTVRDCQTATVRLLLERAPRLKLQNSALDGIARALKRGRGCAELQTLLAGVNR